MSSRHSARSIHAAGSRPPKRRLTRRLLAVLGVTAVAAGTVAYTVLGGTGDGDPDGSPLAQAPVSGDQSHVDVLVDGWTVRTLAESHLGFSIDNGPVTPLNLRPVTDDDVAELLTTTPEIVTNTLARLATVDTALTCDADGCTSGAGDVDPHGLVEPSDIPGYGASYAGYDIAAGLYTARIDTTDAGQVQLVADDYQGLFITPTPQTVDEDGADVVADIFNGYHRGRFLVSGALGQLFHPRPAWLGSEGTGSEVQRFFTTAAEAPGDVAGIDPASPVTFLNGLAPAYPHAATFGATQLTYMSSPTTGCGSGVLCVPGSVTPEILTQNRTASYVCGTDGAHAAVAVLDDVRIRLDLEAPTHQFGVWNGSGPDEFDGAGEGAGMFTGRPPLTEGTMDVRWAEVGFFDSDPLSLRVLAGRTDAGQGADLTGAVSLEEALANLRLDGNHVTICA